MEPFEQQKNGVLLLTRVQSCDVRLHGDESVFDESLPQVVQLPGIDPVENTTPAVTQRTAKAE